MTALQNFNKIAHLAVHVGFNKLPSIKTEQKWLDFIGMNHLNVSNLQSLYCNDDRLLRLITSLALYRNLGKNLAFIEERQPQYETGSLLRNRVELKSISTDTDTSTDDEDTICDIINGHYVKKRDIYKLCALQYVRYRCQFAPDESFSGVEFDGAQILEISPYDTMFITIPSSIISFRISCGGKFYDDPDEYKIIIPYTNNLRELCVNSVELSHSFICVVFL